MRDTFNRYIAPLSVLNQRRYELLYTLLEPILPGLLDEEVSEIFVLNEHDIRVRKRGGDSPLKGRSFQGKDLEALIQQVGTFNHRKIGFNTGKGETPILEGSLPCGSRCSGVLRGINVDSHCLTIRKHHKRMLTPQDLVDYGSITPEALAWLKDQIVAKNSNILISGGTDTGKTTFLNTIANYLPDPHRILLVEDTPELQINKPHVVRFQTSPESGVGFTHLLDLCMRQTGDHIIFGEIRAGQQIRGVLSGSPAYPFVMALNSGHLASMCTIHANGREESLDKFLDYCFFSGVTNVPGEMYAKMVGQAFQVVVQLVKKRGEGRKICESISLCKGYNKTDQRFELADVFRFNEDTQKLDNLSEKTRPLGENGWL